MKIRIGNIKLLMVSMLMLVICFTISGCGGETGGDKAGEDSAGQSKAPLSMSDVVGCWQSEVTGANYVELKEDGTYTVLSHEGTAFIEHGEYVIEDRNILFYSKYQEDTTFGMNIEIENTDDQASMTIEYVDNKTLRYISAFDTGTNLDYWRVDSIPKSKKETTP